ncbi:MAG: HAMP domain-containing protein, partial [Oscillospiraceae bacterium]|nr:HAMP domain-containing protein [Oscillospiraceae bacterium]
MTGKKQNTKGRQRPAIRQYVIFDLGGVGLAVLVMLAIFVVFMRLYYYDSVRRALESPVQGESAERYVQNLLNKNNGDFLAAAQEYVRTFPQKDKMEVWVLDDDGRVAVTSSGFPVKAGDMRDYTMAVHAPDGKGFDILRYHGEPVYAFTYRLNGAGGKFYAMRFMISLRGINRQLVMVALACGAAWLALAVLLLISLWLCERWITKPVTQLSAAAAKIAEGDYKTRVHLPQAPHEINMLAQDISHMTAR